MARREKPQPALIAAATRVALRDPKLAERQAAKRAGWQSESAAYFDEVPEVKFTTNFLGDAIAKLRLYAGVRPEGAPADSVPVPVDDDASDLPPGLADSARAELARLRSGKGGQAGLLRRMNMNFELTGAGYLIGVGAREAIPDKPDGTPGEPAKPERWEFRSIFEVTSKQGIYSVKENENDTQGTPLDPELDACIPMWQEHPLWANKPDSAMRGVLGECKTLQVLSQQVLAQAMRAASAGFFTVPNQLDFGPADPTRGDGESEGGGLVETMADVLMRPIEDPSDPASVQPGLLRGDGEWLQDKYLRRISFYDPQVDTLLEEKIKARIERIARGLNVPVEVVTGHAATTFANAEQIDQDTFEDHLEPRCLLIVDALTVGFLHPNLVDADFDPAEVERVVVWYDPAALVAQPNVEANAEQAHKSFAISDAAYRQALGFTEDDAPDALEVIIRSGLTRGILTAELTAALLKALADEAGVELPSAPSEIAPGSAAPAASASLRDLFALLMAREAQAQARGMPPPTSDTVPLAVAGAGGTATPPGRQLLDIDRELRTRLLIAANDAMSRALDHAGNRLRSRSNGQQDLLRRVPSRLVASTLGRALALRAATTDEALAGAWDELERQFMTWGAGAQEEALNVASRLASGFSTAERATFQLRQAADLAEAWGWMREGLQAQAALRMFDPDPAAPALGEFDPALRVQPGFVRQAIARAGGASGLTTTDEGGAWLALADAGTRPAGGIGTGELVRGALRDNGASVEGYVWRYGPAHRARPLQEHLDLDGTPFVNFDDPVLSNPGSFPETAFLMPGDHSGSLAPGTAVSGPAAIGAALRHWRGVLIDMTTASGQFLSTTPNHPILTGRGWVPAGELVEGDEVVRCVDAEGVAALIPDDRQMPTRVEDVVAAVAMTPGMAALSVPVASEHFHGDGVGSEVAVVWANRHLRTGAEPSLAEPVGEDSLRSADPVLGVPLPSDGAAAQSIERVGHPSLGSVGGDHHLMATLGRSLAGEQSLGGTHVSPLDSEGKEPLADRAAVDAEVDAERLLRLAGCMQLDKLVQVRREVFEGHVYDLQTAERWYLAGGIVAHNCLCDAEPTILGPSEVAPNEPAEA